jgi:hypothetical protein
LRFCHKKKYKHTHSLLLYFFLHPHLHATNYKNSKLNKKYIKHFKIYIINPLKNFWNFRNNGGASSPRAPATGATWVHLPPQAMFEKRVDLAWLPTFFLPSPAVTSKVTCKAFCSLFLLDRFFLLPMVHLVVTFVCGAEAAVEMRGGCPVRGRRNGVYG